MPKGFGVRPGREVWPLGLTSSGPKGLKAQAVISVDSQMRTGPEDIPTLFGVTE